MGAAPLSYQAHLAYQAHLPYQAHLQCSRLARSAQREQQGLRSHERGPQAHQLLIVVVWGVGRGSGRGRGGHWRGGDVTA